jgi:hypothetical protein
VSGDYDYDYDPWRHARVPLPPLPPPGEKSADGRPEQFHEWARSDDPVKRFRAAHGGWDGFESHP